MLCWCAMPAALILLAGAARAQAPDNEATASDLSAEAPLDLSTPEPDEVKTFNLRASDTSAVSEWSSRMGVDYRNPSIPAMDFQPAPLTAGAIPDHRPAWPGRR
jgi:hypothetical protein